MWFATVESPDGSEGTADTSRRDVLVRGDRTDMELIFPLEHEMRFQQVMHNQGLPVPAVHGWIDSPEAYVMDVVAGEPYLLDATPAQRETVMDQYIDALVQLHACDIEAFTEHHIVTTLFEHRIRKRRAQSAWIDMR